MITRRHYESGNVTRREYYGDIAQAGGVDMSGSPLMPLVRKCIQSGDTHLDGIPDEMWHSHCYVLNRLSRHFLDRGDIPTLAGLILVLKSSALSAARQSSWKGKMANGN